MHFKCVWRTVQDKKYLFQSLQAHSKHRNLNRRCVPWKKWQKAIHVNCEISTTYLHHSWCYYDPKHNKLGKQSANKSSPKKDWRGICNVPVNFAPIKFHDLDQWCQTHFSSEATSGKFNPKRPDQCNHCITPWLYVMATSNCSHKL